MRRSLLIAAIIGCLILTACSRSVDDADQTGGTSNEPVPVYTDANAALADGTKFLDTGETDKAIDALNQAVKLDTDLAEAWFKLGIAYSLAELRDQNLATHTPGEEAENRPARKKRNSEIAFEKAVAAYKKQIDTNADDHAAYYNLGRAHNKLNEDEDAAKALKQAVKLMPDDTDYQTELGSILIKLAQYHEAIAPLKKALDLDPENIRAQELLEDAEAGRRRVTYSSTPKDDKKPSNSNTNSNTNSAPQGTKPSPAATPDAGQKPRPTPARPGV